MRFARAQSISRPEAGASSQKPRVGTAKENTAPRRPVLGEAVSWKRAGNVLTTNRIGFWVRQT